MLNEFLEHMCLCLKQKTKTYTTVLVDWCGLSMQEDVFELKALDVGKVLSVTIGHSSIGRGRGWYCAGLLLRVADTSNQLLFPCDRLVHFIVDPLIVSKGQKGKPITELRSVTCHMRSRSVACHLTPVNLPCFNSSQPCRLVLHVSTPEGWKVDLNLVFVVYRDGLPVRRQSSILVVTT